MGRNISLSGYSDLLRSERSGDRIPVGTTYSVPFQTSPQAHPANYTMKIRSLWRAKRPERGVDHIPESSAEVKERIEL